MTLTELKYIVAVAREKHFGKAAEACFVSQPTLSVAIKKLEEELEVKLFERSANEVSVTPLGEEIVRQAQSVLEQAAAIKEIAKRGKDPLAGPLKLGVIYTIGPYLLPDLVRQAIRMTPQMPLMLQENFTVKLLEQLRLGEIDCAILAEPFPDTNRAIAPLYDEPFLAAVPHTHALAHSVQALQVAAHRRVACGRGGTAGLGAVVAGRSGDRGVEEGGGLPGDQPEYAEQESEGTRNRDGGLTSTSTSTGSTDSSLSSSPSRSSVSSSSSPSNFTSTSSSSARSAAAT